MRVTSNQLNRNMIDVINSRYNDLADLQEQLSTGKRLRRPSDDPVDVANDLQLRSRQKELLQHKKNIEDATSIMSITETAMESMNTLLQKVRELSVQAASDTMSSKERQYINREVEQLTRQVVALLNTKHKGDYIFNGQQTKLPAITIDTSASSTVDDYTALNMSYFNAAAVPVGTPVQIFNARTGNPVTSIIPGSFELAVAGTSYKENTDYTIDYEAGTITIINPALALNVTPGTPEYDINRVQMSFDALARSRDVFGQVVSNRGSIEREVESGITMAVNIGMDEMTTDMSSGVNLLGTLIRFGQALEQNNTLSINKAIDEVDLSFNAVLSAQSKNGARVNRLQTTLERNENQYTQVTELQSNLEDAEMAGTVSKFMLTQNVYNAALQTTAKIIQPSLVNFL